MDDLTVLVRKDGRVALLGQREMDAGAVEALARSLIAARAVMAPRRMATMFPGTPILLGDEDVLHVQGEVGGRVLLAVHLAGAGWVGSRLGREALTGLIGAPSFRTPRRNRAEGQPP